MERVMFTFLLLVFLVSNVQSQAVNTERPVFNPLNYDVTIHDNQPLDITVITVSATDPDAVGTSNVEYLATGNGRALQFFSLDKTTGEISVKKPLQDDKSVDNIIYTMTVSACDFGTPSLQSLLSATVVIIVVRNNFSPVFENTPYSTAISQSTSPYTSVFQVTAVDADIGDVVSYSITGDNEALDLFSIDQNGDIQTTDNVFADLELSYTIQVMAQDNGVPVRSAVEEVVVTRAS